MTDEELKLLVESTVDKTIRYLSDNKMLKEPDDVVYSDAVDLITNYYKNGKTNMDITYAIQGLRFDPYFKIIPMYFEEGQKIERIAEALNVDVRTVTRNKKRLCIAIYHEVV